MNRYPYHRYLRYLVLDGDDVAEVRRHIAALGLIPPKGEDVQFLIDTIKLGRIVDDAWMKKCDVDICVEKSEDMDGCHWLIENAPAREVIQKALLDGMSARNCAHLVTLKFHRQLTERSASLFRRIFWDTEALTLIDFANYYAIGKQRKPDPPAGMPMHLRPAFQAWKNGLLPDEETLATDDIVRAIQVEAYMRFTENAAMGTPFGAEEARKWSTVALRTSVIRKPPTKDTSKQDKLPGMKPKVFYPKQNVPTLDQLDNPDVGGGDDPI